MKLRRNLPEIAAYIVGSVVLSAAGRAFLPHGFDRLAALSADFSAGSLLAWAAAIAAAGAMIGALLHRRDWIFHAPAALCFGLAVVRCTAPDPRVDRIEPILLGLPGWPWLFALETVLWAGLIALGVWTAGKVVVALQSAAGAADDIKAACREPVSQAVWLAGDLPDDERMTRAGLTAKRREYLRDAVGEPIPEAGDPKSPLCRLTPELIRWAQTGVLLAGLVMLVLLLRSESYKQAVFAQWAGWLTAASLALGFLPVDMPWRTMFLPAGLGVAVYVFSGLGGAQLDRFDTMNRLAMFALPIDWAAVGALGVLMGTRPGGYQDFCWSAVRSLASCWHRFRSGTWSTGKPMPGFPAPATATAGRSAAPPTSSAPPRTDSDADRKNRGKKRKKTVTSVPTAAGASAVPSPGQIAADLKAFARTMGFEPVGLTTADPPETYPALQRWLDAGRHGEMAFMADAAAMRADPKSLLESARSILCLGFHYWPHEGPPTTPESGPAVSSSGSVAAYVRGREYHRRLRKRMIQICRHLEAFVGRPVETRCCIDLHPIMERDLAMRAGLGWIGKNTLLLHPRRGSYMFLAEILIALDLPPDPPMTDHCGSCTACLDACPTDAFAAPWVLDARKCISYLTIEKHGPLDDGDRAELGAHIYGCDICQDVCPFNRKTPQTELPAFRETRTEVRTVAQLIELVGLTEAAFFARFNGTALMRAKRQGLVRNAALALGNIGDPAALPALQRAAQDADPVVAEAAKWALERLRTITDFRRDSRDDNE